MEVKKIATGEIIQPNSSYAAITAMSATVEKAKIVRKPNQINSRISPQRNIAMSTEQVVGTNNSQPKEVVLDTHDSINIKLSHNNHIEIPEQVSKATLS